MRSLTIIFLLLIAVAASSSDSAESDRSYDRVVSRLLGDDEEAPLMKASNDDLSAEPEENTEGEEAGDKPAGDENGEEEPKEEDAIDYKDGWSENNSSTTETPEPTEPTTTTLPPVPPPPVTPPPTTTPTTTLPPVTTSITTTSTAGAAELGGSDAAVYGISGAVVFLIIIVIIILVVLRKRKQKKEGDKPKKSMGKSRTPSTRNNTDTSQVGRPLLSGSSEQQGTPGAVSANVHTDVTPGTGATTTPSQQPQMRDLNETPGGLPPSQDVFIPGEQPYKIPAKNFKWCGPMKRKSRWHGPPDHDFDGVEGVKKLDRIWFDPNANTATEIGPSEIIEDAGPASDSNRSEFLNNLDEWERNHKIYMAQKAAEKEGKGNKPEEGGVGGGTPDSKKENKPQ